MKSRLASLDCPYARQRRYGLRSHWRSSKSIVPIRCPVEETVTTRAAMRSSSRLVSAKCPRWFVPNWSSKPSTVRDSGGTITPALLISRSTSPCQSAANARMEPRLARSSGRTSAPGMPAAAASPFVVSRTARTTCAPAPASARAAARPMPELAPVMIAVRPVRSGRSAVLHVVMGNNVDAENNVVNDNSTR